MRLNMPTIAPVSNSPDRRKEIFNHYYNQVAIRTDRMFGVLFIFQWLLAIAFALWITPRTWIGEDSRIHLHVYASVFLGGVTAIFPIYLAKTQPGHPMNRFVIAIAQMIYSILFVHLTGGRIETHFHIFGSLAFLAFYRDFRPVLLATIITALDHLVRGFYFPESVYGVASATPWRALEHAGWVIFEDVVLFFMIRDMIALLEEIADRQLKVEAALSSVEEVVMERTAELKKSQDLVTEQQQALAVSSKMSALGEMAGGVAHEINTPLAIIGMRLELLHENLLDGSYTVETIKESLAVIQKTTDRIGKIVKGLKFFATDGRREEMRRCSIKDLVDETTSFCKEKFSNHGVDLQINTHSPVELFGECRSVEISQVILNLLNNAFDAIQGSDKMWVKIDTRDLGNDVEIAVTDSGLGIPDAIQKKLMQPFFTTKDVGKGTGLGLSISNGIMRAHRGKLYYDSKSPNTRFVLVLPKFKVRDAV